MKKVTSNSHVFTMTYYDLSSVKRTKKGLSKPAQIVKFEGLAITEYCHHFIGDKVKNRVR